jgi:predicted DNA-binding protein YlxM (UPF0122 family)
MPQGEANGTTVLSDNQVVAMRQLYLSAEWSMAELAAKFHVPKSTVQAVVNCVNWRWLLDPGEEQALRDVRAQRDTKQSRRKELRHG